MSADLRWGSAVGGLRWAVEGKGGVVEEMYRHVYVKSLRVDNNYYVIHVCKGFSFSYLHTFTTSGET